MLIMRYNDDHLFNVSDSGHYRYLYFVAFASEEINGLLVRRLMLV